MKILSITPISGERIDFGLEHEFIRYGKDSWYECYGNCDEPKYDCEEYEEAYQEFINK